MLEQQLLKLDLPQLTMGKMMNLRHKGYLGRVFYKTGLKRLF
jgi:hypothetical protein